LAWFSCDMLSVFVNLFLGLWSVCLVLLFLIVVVWVLDLLLDRLSCCQAKFLFNIEVNW